MLRSFPDSKFSTELQNRLACYRSSGQDEDFIKFYRFVALIHKGFIVYPNVKR